MTSLYDGCWCWRWRGNASRYSGDELILLETTFCGRARRSAVSVDSGWPAGRRHKAERAALHLHDVTRPIVNDCTDFLISRRRQLEARTTATTLTCRQQCKLCRRRNTDTTSVLRAAPRCYYQISVNAIRERASGIGNSVTALTEKWKTTETTSMTVDSLTGR